MLNIERALKTSEGKWLTDVRWFRQGVQVEIGNNYIRRTKEAVAGGRGEKGKKTSLPVA